MTYSVGDQKNDDVDLLNIKMKEHPGLPFLVHSTKKISIMHSRAVRPCEIHFAFQGS